MSKVKIHGGEQALVDVFSDRYVFRIPAYQRPYSWTTDEVAELLDDLELALSESAPSDPEPYFLGSIVLAKNEGTPQAQVIDGQQRLTTLTILLSALADRLDATQLRKYLRQEGDEFAGSEEIPRLTLRERDAEFFRTYVQEEGGLAALAALDGAKLSGARQNIQANALLIRERLQEKTEDWVKQLATYLIQHCWLIVVSTPDSDSAFRIFAVLNDRGLDLTAADIIKNELIGGIDDPPQQDAYTKKWEDAEEALGTDAFGELFSHIRMIYGKTKSRTSLLKAFRATVLSEVTDERAFIDDVVAPYADIFATIIDQNWKATEHAGEINELIGWLQRIDNFDWVPPVLRFCRDHQQDSATVLRYLRSLERLAGSMFIRRVGVNARIERYGAILKAIDTGEGVLAEDSPLQLDVEEKRETLRRLDGEVYTLGRPRSYVLLRLDAALNAGGAVYDHKIITVEHVLPQNPPQASEWNTLFTEEEHEFWVHRLANLVLLDRRKNSKASNFEFDRKKREYFTTKDETSPFQLTTQTLAMAKWTPQVLADRQTKLIEKVAGIWRLERHAEPTQ